MVDALSRNNMKQLSHRIYGLTQLCAWNLAAMLVLSLLALPVYAQQGSLPSFEEISSEVSERSEPQSEPEAQPPSDRAAEDELWDISAPQGADAPTEPASTGPEHHSRISPSYILDREGGLGFHRIAVPRAGKSNMFRFGFLGEFYSGADTIRYNDENDTIVGNLLLQATISEYFSVNLAVRAKNNVNSFGRTQAMLSQGDTLLGARGHFEATKGLDLGADLTLYLPTGFGTAGFQGSAMSVRPRLLMAMDWAKLSDASTNWDTYFNLGYRFDGTENLVPEGRNLSRVERFAYDIRAYDAIELGIGVQIHLPYVTPFLGWNLDIPVGEPEELCEPGLPLSCVSEAGFAAYPHTLSIGFKADVMQHFGLHAGVDLGLTREDAQGLPITLPYNVMFGLNWALDFVPRVVVQEIEKIVEVEVEVEVDRTPPQGVIVGRIADRVTKKPVGNALIQYMDRDETMQASAEETGEYRSYGFKPGEELIIRIVHPDYRPTRVRHVVEEGEQTVNVEIAPLARQGWIRGFVRDEGGNPVGGALVRVTGESAHETRTNAEGRFEQQVRAGRYTIAASAPDYQTSGRDVTLEADGTVDMDVILRPAAAESLAELVHEEIRIHDRIFFETGNAKLLPRSFNVLNAVATVMLENPHVKKLQIEGHTDDVGAASMNLELSKDRASSVRQYLIEQGIDPERLSSQGFGSERPLVPNTSDRNRSVNRRVEFRVVEQGTSE